jgi:hypothetical protein
VYSIYLVAHAKLITVLEYELPVWLIRELVYSLILYLLVLKLLIPELGIGGETTEESLSQLFRKLT